MEMKRVSNEPEPKDTSLEALFDTVLGYRDENEDATIHLTMMLGGSIISGRVISYRKYARLFARRLCSSHPGAEVEPRDHDDNNDDRRPIRQHFHMDDVHIINGSSRVDVPLWRGNLNDVTGWSHARLIDTISVDGE
jgi:hypothetical protein